MKLMIFVSLAISVLSYSVTCAPVKISPNDAAVKSMIDQVMPSLMKQLDLTGYSFGQVTEAWRTSLGRGDSIDFRFEMINLKMANKKMCNAQIYRPFVNAPNGYKIIKANCAN